MKARIAGSITGLVLGAPLWLVPLCLLLHDDAAGQIGAAAGADFEVAEHKLIEIRSIAEVEEGHTVLLTDWSIPDELDHRKYEDGKLLVIAGPPGKYVLRQNIVTARTEGDVIKLPVRQKFAVYQLTITSVGPRPPPKDPEKPEDPVVEGKRAAAIVYESSEGAVPLAADAAARELRAKDVEVRVVDKDVVTGTGGTPAHLKPFLDAAKNVRLPALIVTADGKAIKAIPLPASKEAIVREVTDAN